MQLLIVGEMPTERAGLERAFEGSGSADRLCRLLGVQPGQLHVVVDTLNVFDGPMPKWNSEEARRNGDQLRALFAQKGYSHVLLCGRRVGQALRLSTSEPYFQWGRLWPHPSEEITRRKAERWTIIPVKDVYPQVALIPHPSGLSRWWNERENRLTAMRFMAEMAVGRRLF